LWQLVGGFAIADFEQLASHESLRNEKNRISKIDPINQAAFRPQAFCKARKGISQKCREDKPHLGVILRTVAVWCAFDDEVWFSEHITVLTLLIIGWFLTAVAASLGAPFWFDILSRIMNVRNSGGVPGEKDPTSTPIGPQATLDETPGTRASREAWEGKIECCRRWMRGRATPRLYFKGMVV
jgi:hypothetical protein